jgi:TonB-linked SusC/RagA family outer membrane protein
MALAQRGVVTGTVTDGETGEPLPGATVQVVGTGIGTATDIDGNYSINLTPGTKQLRASFVGYATVTQEADVTADETTTVNFELDPSTAELGEVVVTGVTSETPKSKLSFTVDQVNAEALQKVAPTNAMQALQGKVAGATILGGSGEPGAGFNVRLRATTSLTGDNSPLFIVDGVILGADQVDISALDVKSIEVVKGAAASSLYGSRAQNGVINITTQRGSETPLGQTRVTVRNEFGWQSLRKQLSPNQAHSLLMNDSGQLVNSNGEPVNYGEGAAPDQTGPNNVSFRDNLYSDLRQVNGSPYALYDPFDQFFNPGNNFTNYVAISQNSETTNFRASFENTREPGVIRGPVSAEGLTRRSFRLNLDHRPSDNTSFRASGYYSNSKSDRVDASEVEDPFFSLQFLTPLSNLLERDDNGELIIQPDPRAVEANPLYIIENLDISRERSRFLGNFGGEYSPFQWATLSGSISYDRSDRDYREFADKGFKSIDPTPENEGEIEKESFVQEALNYDVTLSLNRDFGDFTGRSQFKYQVEDTQFESVFAQGNDLAAAGIPDFANIQDDASKSLNSFTSIIRAEGFYATVQGDYLDRYIFDALIRRDGSSLFGSEERWQTYYRLAGAYRLSQESFWPFQNSLNEFKLRYAYGRAGARPEYEAQYETFSLSDGNLSKATLGNSALKPELSTEQEFGLEISFFDRAYLDVTYARQLVEDQLLEVPLIGPLGFANQWQNAGTLQSNTIEISLNGTVFRTRDAILDMGLTFDRTRQEITEFNTNAFQTGPEDLFYYRDDEQIGAMYGAQWITERSQLQEMGLDPSNFDQNNDGYFVPVGSGNSWQDGISESLWGTTVSTAAGDLAWGIPVEFVDSEGEDFFQIGNTIPDFNLNFNTSFSYKGLTAYTLLSYQHGGDIYNFTKQWSYRDGRAGDQDQFGKSDATKKTNQYYETLYSATNKNNHFVEDGTFLKVREISLGYTFDRAQLNNLLGGSNILNRVSFTVTGRNLFTFTDYTGFDPEVGDGDDATLFRVDNFDYPPFRTVTGRLEFQF